MMLNFVCALGGRNFTSSVYLVDDDSSCPSTGQVKFRLIRIRDVRCLVLSMHQAGYVSSRPCTWREIHAIQFTLSPYTRKKSKILSICFVSAQFLIIFRAYWFWSLFLKFLIIRKRRKKKDIKLSLWMNYIANIWKWYLHSRFASRKDAPLHGNFIIKSGGFKCKDKKNTQFLDI